MEVCWDDKLMASLLAKKQHAYIVASYHETQLADRPWKSTKVRNQINLAKKYGDVVKLVVKATAFQDNLDLFDLAQTSFGDFKRPLILINMGAVGQISRAMNLFLTPVTHATMPTSAAPGQLSVKQIYEVRRLLGLLSPKQFYLFGSPIAHSMSPLLHNTGFEMLGGFSKCAIPGKYYFHAFLPLTCIGMYPTYKYLLLENAEITDEHLALFKSENFGGASVTIPLKEAVFSYMDALTDSAKEIGAVNTVIRQPDGTLVGDNTDWLGILSTTRYYLGNVNRQVSQPWTVLVIGAGGTARAACYAAFRLNDKKPSRVCIWNRTNEKANLLRRQFPDLEVLDANEVKTTFASSKPHVIISTIPGSAHTELPVSIRDLFAVEGKHGIYVELAYRPYITELMHLAQQHGWFTVAGIDILIEQGYHQFQRWTGRIPPKAAMKEKVQHAYHTTS
jgi:pentafunctional AROM polypeptide